MYSMKQIMVRAWAIKRQDMRNDFGLCLRMAWSEAKATKRAFRGYAEMDTEYGYKMIFRSWENYGMRRIYVTREGYKQSVGYIDCSHGNRFVPAKYTCECFREIADAFCGQYGIA